MITSYPVKPLRGRIMSLTKLVLDTSHIAHAGVFRIPERATSIFVSDAVAQALAANEITGVRFLPVACSD